LNILVEKLREVFVSVFPITVIVFILHFTIAPVELHQLFRFIIGAALIFIGLSVFLLGVDLGVSQIGHLMGSANTVTSPKIKPIITIIHWLLSDATL